jgi:hypothetical protein
MKLGVISDSRYLITDPGREWFLHSFTISPDALSFSKIFHSAFATPARYVQEIFLRLCTLDESEGRGAKFVFNPLFDSSRLDILLVLAALKEAPPFDGITLLTDKDGLPAGYLLPPWLDTEDARFLTLLSTVDGDVDATLCRLLFQIETRCLQVPRLSLARAQHNGFIYEENRDIYRWVAERAIALLRTKPSRNEIPFTAIMPHHAGDVLFFTLAFNLVHPPINRIAVNRAYLDIVKDNAPGLAVLPIVAPLINRSDKFQQGKVTPEGLYFHSIKNELPEDSFYNYCRPSRDYNVSLFHLIDHFAFALGKRFYASKYLVANNMPSITLFQPETPIDAPLKVLLHFDGGWPLKVYPKPQQEQLIELLRTKGYTVTVLTGSDRTYSNCEVTTFHGYAQFKALLQTQHLMVGMDSFPAHYAAHVLGLPTLCLFACTRPENSDAPSASNYIRLEEGLPCRPCYGIARCPMYGGSSCRNFVSPETVAETVQLMLETVRKENAIRQVVKTIHFVADELCKPMPDDEPSNVKRISLNHIRLKVALACAILPFHRYISLLYLPHLLYREFSAAIRVEGFFLACLRTLRFLLKTFRLNTNSKNQ